MTKPKFAPESREISNGEVNLVAVRINVVSGNNTYTWLLRDEQGRDLGVIRWHLRAYAFHPDKNCPVLSIEQMQTIAGHCKQIHNERVPS